MEDLGVDEKIILK